jgi:hypothetical protein
MKPPPREGLAPRGHTDPDAKLTRIISVFFRNGVEIKIELDILRLLNEPSGVHWIETQGSYYADGY